MILLGNGRTGANVADVLRIDSDTVRDYSKRAKKTGREGLLRMSYVGSVALLDAGRLAELDLNLHSFLYLMAEVVARFVGQRWGVQYTWSGMTAVLHRFGYVYKKAKLEAGKQPEPEIQEAFVEKYENIKKHQGGAYKSQPGIRDLGKHWFFDDVYLRQMESRLRNACPEVPFR